MADHGKPWRSCAPSCAPRNSFGVVRRACQRHSGFLSTRQADAPGTDEGAISTCGTGMSSTTIERWG